jgi:hypothetical protein
MSRYAGWWCLRLWALERQRDVSEVLANRLTILCSIERSDSSLEIRRCSHETDLSQTVLWEGHTIDLRFSVAVRRESILIIVGMFKLALAGGALAFFVQARDAENASGYPMGTQTKKASRWKPVKRWFFGRDERI